MTIKAKSLEFSGKEINFKDFLIHTKTFIETGTCYGRTVDTALSVGYERVKSVEVWPPFYESCKNKFAGMENVELYFGKSTELLPQMLKDVKGPAVFWLDAHPTGPNTGGHDDLMEKGDASEYHQDSVIGKEIDIILSHDSDNHIIIIDDQNGLNETSAKFINQITEVNPSYKFYFVDERMGDKYYENKILVCSPY